MKNNLHNALWLLIFAFFVSTMLTGCGGGGNGEKTTSGGNGEKTTSDDNGTEQQPESFRLHWPVPGVDGVDWVINNYVDLDPGPGLRDYREGTKVYDGHNGVDIDVPNFRWMDNDFPILAAAAGRITALHDGEYDRNVSCVGDWNFVEITHLNELRSIYGHLKKGSVEISIGQEVKAGQELGVIGSSGCSTAPHLHFELRSKSGEVIDPFLEKLWRDPPHYDRPLTLMDYNVQDGMITGVDDVKDPPPNIDSIFVGSTLGVGLSAAGGDRGDELRVVLRSGNNGQEYDRRVTFQKEHRHSYWYWNIIVSVPPGIWRMEVHVNGESVADHEITVMNR